MVQLAAASWKSIETAAPHVELGRQVASQSGVLTFEARQVDANRRIHIRAFPLEQSPLGQSSEQVARAVGKLRALNHPGLAAIYGGGTADGVAYIETEMVRGTPADEFVSKRRLTDRQQLELLTHVCKTLAYLHSQGIRYGQLVPGGALIQRQRGSLRYEAKLHRCEAMRGFKPDGSEQHAFAALIKALIGSAPREGSVIDAQLRQLAAKCAAATGDAPSFAEITAQLNALAQHTQQAAAGTAIHLAEPLEMEIPGPKVAPQAGAKSTSPAKLAGVVGGVTAAIVVGLLAWLDSDSRFDSSSSRRGRQSSRTTTYAPSYQQPSYYTPPPPPPSAGSQRYTQPQYAQPPYAQPPYSQPPRPQTPPHIRQQQFHFQPAAPRPPTPMNAPFQRSTGQFARPKFLSGPELAEDAFALSNPKWGSDTLGPVLSVDFTCQADVGAHPRLVWVIESSGEPQYEARMFTNVGASGSLQGAIFITGNSQLQRPLTTYLAEDSIGLEAPRRVSNVLSIAETPFE